jgi:hypothetical protein
MVARQVPARLQVSDLTNLKKLTSASSSSNVFNLLNLGRDDFPRFSEIGPPDLVALNACWSQCYKISFDRNFRTKLIRVN